MEEKDNLQWIKLFRDEPIPKVALENFQAQLMAQIVAQPVDFGAESRLAARRKWGLGLAFSLMFTGLLLGTVLWFGSEILYQGLNSLLVMFAGFPYVSELQQFGQRILESLILFKELKIGIDLLWGVVSWPLLGVLCVIVVFRNPHSIYEDSTIKEA
ncbi:hypothetical protein [Desulfosporosinus nitroreducens]|uniref:Uncharacterized protein n=1 Tax=Desulfosporosinus nitroreducens TaxID=2018668 RepID=A0ABT8QQI0_9FIRM|nr:hypothetical protein [Desulfosporosinus nitroreducens]MCO1602691.1 hypothetical protein [Desulfosporosinus nitroreducens]MDO0823602.1 hypothetical protein [Desulfosporosinus nitroreducens]